MGFIYFPFKKNLQLHEGVCLSVGMWCECGRVWEEYERVWVWVWVWWWCGYGSVW